VVALPVLGLRQKVWDRRADSTRMLSWSGLFVVVIALVMAAGLSVGVFFAITWIGGLGDWGPWGWILYGVVMVGWAGWFLGRNAFRWWRDHQLARRLQRGEVACETYEQMLSALDSFRSERALLLFVQGIKRNPPVVSRPETLRALRDFSSSGTVAQTVRDEVAKMVADSELARQTRASTDAAVFANDSVQVPRATVGEGSG
jgi:hypothetical protein